MNSEENDTNIKLTIKYGTDNESIDVSILNENKIIKGFTKDNLKDEIIIVDGDRINLGKHIFDNFDKYTQLSIIDYDDELPVFISIQNNEFLIQKINNTYVDESVCDIIKDIGLTSYIF